MATYAYFESGDITVDGADEVLTTLTVQPTVNKTITFILTNTNAGDQQALNQFEVEVTMDNDPNAAGAVWMNYLVAWVPDTDDRCENMPIVTVRMDTLAAGGSSLAVIRPYGVTGIRFVAGVAANSATVAVKGWIRHGNR